MSPRPPIGAGSRLGLVALLLLGGALACGSFLPQTTASTNEASGPRTPRRAADLKMLVLEAAPPQPQVVVVVDGEIVCDLRPATGNDVRWSGRNFSYARDGAWRTCTTSGTHLYQVEPPMGLLLAQTPASAVDPNGLGPRDLGVGASLVATTEPAAAPRGQGSKRPVALEVDGEPRMVFDDGVLRLWQLPAPMPTPEARPSPALPDAVQLRLTQDATAPAPEGTEAAGAPATDDEAARWLAQIARTGLLDPPTGATGETGPDPRPLELRAAWRVDLDGDDHDEGVLCAGLDDWGHCTVVDEPDAERLAFHQLILQGGGGGRGWTLFRTDDGVYLGGLTEGTGGTWQKIVHWDGRSYVVQSRRPTPEG